VADSNLILTYARDVPQGEHSVVGRRLALALLARLDGRAYRDTDIVTGSRGKPSIVGAAHFSIAHCVGLVVAAASRVSPIGVDIEPAARNAEMALRKVADAEEQALVARTGSAFVWVAKEAAIKCLGLSALMAGEVRLCGEFALARAVVISLQRPAVASGFHCAVATQQPLSACVVSADA
jgi:phosphopantetheinyl transferase